MDSRTASDALYEQFARIAKALGHPKRFELLELLAQGERTVEALAAASQIGLSTASAQLQVLRRARLVATRREGQRVHYRLAGDQVLRGLGVLRELARTQLAEVGAVLRDFVGDRDALEPVGRDELLTLVRTGDVLVLDVRPPEEFREGHIPGAVSVPLEQLEARLAGLPRGSEVVAYCRGPYCVLAPEAVARLRAHGFRARRLAEGFPEWRLAGLPVAAGDGAG